MTSTKLHHTMGVYPNGDRKHNGVADEDLAVHLEYNETFRPGRALFVDGKCRLKGSLSPAQIAAIEKELEASPRVVTRCTRPYQ